MNTLCYMSKIKSINLLIDLKPTSGRNSIIHDNQSHIIEYNKLIIRCKTLGSAVDDIRSLLANNDNIVKINQEIIIEKDSLN